MTVKQLFGHFTFAFSKIVYFDKDENVEDKVIIRCGNGNWDGAKYYEFLDDYGECTIEEWKYDYEDNSIQIEFVY